MKQYQYHRVSSNVHPDLAVLEELQLWSQLPSQIPEPYRHLLPGIPVVIWRPTVFQFRRLVCDCNALIDGVLETRPSPLGHWNSGTKADLIGGRAAPGLPSRT